ncbi:MAG: GntR family transcriptional regulator [Corynebacterium sp.]|uniref:GntR family transcriptional regulator n=1 Tax=Corynebacterium sp. TaxID=1720 RepID=UPI0026DEEF8C|nr:GntR family transcriptional regulator [Corynebacterium sp.]MDO5670194.1 GntR family transcriptional regulator [Corynebacterium sp.]
MREIDRTSSTPIWYQVLQDLKQQINTGKLPPGTKLPSEKDLADRYDISRVTLRHSLGALAEDGFIKRVHGDGTYVTQKHLPVQQELALTVPWRTRLEEEGRRVDAIVTRNDSTPAIPSEVAAMCTQTVHETELAGPFIIVERVQLIDGYPVGISQSWIPGKRVPGLTSDHPLIEGSLSRKLRENFQLASHTIDNLLSIQLTTVYETELLQCDPDEPLFTVVAVTRDKDDKLIQLSRTVWLSSRVRFRQVRKSSNDNLLLGP